MIRPTQAGKKLLLDFEKFTYNIDFEKNVSKIRSILSIPDGGLKYSEDDQKSTVDSYWVPGVWKPPENFIEDSGLNMRHVNDKDHFGYVFNALYNRHSKKLFPEKFLSNSYLYRRIKSYVLFGEFIDIEGVSIEEENIVAIRDAEDEYNVFSHNEDPEERVLSVRDHNDKVADELFRLPISIRFSASASITDIVDFVRKNKTRISALQKEYEKSDIYNLKYARTGVDKKKRKRDALIYDNRKLSFSEICQKVGKELGKEYLPDPGFIKVIVAREKERRGE